MKLKNKVVVITGASQGLGKELAKKISGEGSIVLLIARSEDLLIELRSEIESKGGSAEYFVCDIRDLENVRSAAKKIKDKFQKIDILINNAGIWTDNELEEIEPGRRNNAFETNVLGHIQVTEEFLPLLNIDDSIIFNVISTSGVPNIPAGNNSSWKTYGASKWGMVGYTNSLKESLRDTNTKVIQYFPGGFESNLYENAGRDDPHGQPWMMRTEDVADIVLFALTRPEDVYVEQIVVSKKMR